MRRRIMSRRRLPTPAGPAEIGRHEGLAYTLWLPDREPGGSLLMVHGAGSQKENQHDIARAARACGFAAICFDQRGHGESDGALDGHALEDVATMAALLPRPLALRGTSMGGCIALAASELVRPEAVVAICAASPEGLLRGLRAGMFPFRWDPSIEPLLERLDLFAVVERMTTPLLLMHAEGDERVPVAHSRELHARAGHSKLITPPGGHHQSIQHDEELTGVSLQFVRRAFLRGEAGPPARPSPPPSR
jgi:pimeloyl-ACP methyl ester carboxylesterase